ncbi:MAG: outer membrane beta-barrel protein [Bacteroidales bacterium]|nr:outer membrane beta-barrel protein [Bacteroidales bacterium]
MEQENGIQEFDLKVKSLLADAEEPVPAGAWEGIAARLGAAAPVAASGTASAAETAAWASAASTATKVPMWVWLRRAGIATAAVAASATLFFTLREPKVEPAAESAVAPIAELVEEPVAEPVEVVEVPAARPAVVAQAETKEPAAPKAAASKSVKPSKAEAKPERVEVVRSQEREPLLAQALEAEAPASAGTVAEKPSVEAKTLAVEEGEPIAETSVAVAAVPSKVEQNPGGAVADWERLAREEERAQSRKVNGLHLAAGTNAMSNFITGNVNIAPMRTSGGGVPDHSYVTENGEVSYSIPLTFGVNVTYDLAPHWSLGIGLNYTRLSRSFAGTWNERLDDGTFKPAVLYDNINNIQQFIGIPITAYYHILRTERINLYVHAGGMVEKCLGNTWTANARELNYTESVKGAQLSVGAGIGVDFMLASFVSLYLDPDVKYYFALNQPKSIRTKQPFMLGFELGVRFHL